MKNKERGLTYCRLEYKNLPRLQRTSLKYCPICKFKIRGKNHENGKHHLEIK